jgi:signal transduction histidine kinase
MAKRGSVLVLSVADDGPGFHPDEPTRDGALGLQGMNERVVMLGGTFEITSVPGEGTRVEACLPMDGGANE